MSQQSIQFLSSETETYGKQQPAWDRPGLSSDLFKEAIHTFSPRRGLPCPSDQPQHRDLLVGFSSEVPFLGHSLGSEAPVFQLLFFTNASRPSQFDKLTFSFSFFFLRRSNNYMVFKQGYPRKSKKQ